MLRHQKLTYSLLAILSVAVIAAGGYMFLRPRPIYSRVGIDEAYQHIQIPSSLELQYQKWEDLNSFDTQISSAWLYTYKIKEGYSTDQIKEDIEKNLTSLNYTIDNGYRTSSSNQHRFSAQNRNIRIDVSIGYALDSQHTSTDAGDMVFITAKPTE